MGEARPRVALITGASRGIGRAIALSLARDGLDVVINYRAGAEAAEEVVDLSTEFGSRAKSYQAEIGSPLDEERLAYEVLEDFGSVDVLVHNAGIASRGSSIVDSDADEFERLLQVHALGPLRLSRLLIPQMRRRPRGDIVMISSRATVAMRAGGGVYNIAKSAMEALAMTLAHEEQQSGIRVNVVAPGLTVTDMGDRLARATRLVDASSSASDLDDTFPFGRVCRPSDVAEVVSFLVSEAGSYVSGQRIQVDGGGA
jgi:NAD(P)-dependent dehydrogenase (short-subunit alcohol dehydrogenase family)